MAFFQAVRAALVKRAPGEARPEEELDHAVRQIIARAVAPEGVVDIFTAAGLQRPDISILSDEFLAEVRGMPQRNLAVELLQKLLKGEIRTRLRKNVVQARSFAEMLERTLRRYQNRAIEAAQVIEELIQLAKDMRAANARGEELGLTEDELAFYDALETNDSAVKVLGDETLRSIARELVATVRNNVTIDWTLRENIRAQLRVLVKRILRKHGYPPDKAQEIVKLLTDFKDGDTRRITKDGKEEEVVVSRIFPTTHFDFRKITVERPLRLNFQATLERIARLEEEKGFQALAQSKKKGAAGAKEQAEGRAQQEAIRRLLRGLPDTLIKDRDEFERLLDAAAKQASVKLPAPARKAILSALSERDESAAICRDKDGNPKPDPELRDTESVPLPAGDDPTDQDGVPASVRAFFEREVKPHVPDAWIDTTKRDPRDGRVGLVGYGINFNRYFYRYTPPRPFEVIEADIRAIEQDIVRMLAEVTGGPA